MGSQEPSERVAPDYLDTDGADAVRLMAVGGVIFDPWQSDVLEDWMSLTPGRKWLCRTCGGSVPRQNGKTGIVQGRAAAGMILYNEMVIYTAHLQKTSTETFEEMAVFFDSPKWRPYLKDIKTALGRERIIMKSGANIKFLARTRSGGRGQHGDLLIFDEAQELDEDQQASFLPAISASLNPQTIYVGTPPEPQSPGVVFRGIRDKALSGKTRTAAWFEYSVPEIGDVSDPERWAATNPALGRRILLSTIEGECEQMPPDTFARERLGWWSPIAVDRIDYAIKANVWDSCVSDAKKPDGKTAYGVKFSPDGTEVCLCGAVIPESGPARISLIKRESTARGLSWLAAWLNERYSRACCVVIDGRNGVDALIDKIVDVWKIKGSIVRPTSRDLIGAVGMLCDALSDKEVTWYRGQEALRESAVSSVKRPVSGGWAFGGDNAIPIEACALAFYGAKTSKRNPAKKMRIG